jgi:hypothetical protein
VNSETDNWDRFCVSCIMMATYRRLNRQKEELCKREGIDQTRRAEFRDIGDASPLFRCVFFLDHLVMNPKSRGKLQVG